MSKDPAVLFYIDTWLSSTAEMDADARGWYLNLLLHNYDKGDLPNDVERLAQLAQVKYSEYKRFEQVFEQVLEQKFERTEDGRLSNPQTNEVLQKRKKFKEKRSNSGKMSYVVRYAKEHKGADTNQIEFIKANIDLSQVDTKNEHLLEQVLEHLFELYKNENEDGNGNENKRGGAGGENKKELTEPQQQLNNWFKENYPFVSKLKLPKPEQMTKLKQLYGERAIYDTLEAMENYKPLQNYRDAYLTLNKWLKKQKPTKDHTTNNPEILNSNDIRGML